MGFLDRLTGKDAANAARDASSQSVEFQREGLDEIRRQFDISQQNIQPFINSGLPHIQSLSRGATPEGFANSLSLIMGGGNPTGATPPIVGVSGGTRSAPEFGVQAGPSQGIGGIFSDLVNQRQDASNSALTAAGLSRSGFAAEEAARIPTELALQLEGLLNSRQQNLVSNSQNAVTGQSALGQSASAQINQGLSGIGQTIGQGITGAAAARAQGAGDLLGTAASLAGMFFSDPMLKENIVHLGDIKGRKVYGWDYKEEVPDFVKSGMTTGFMADEVELDAPQFVYDVAGVKIIDYEKYLDYLEAA